MTRTFASVLVFLLCFPPVHASGQEAPVEEFRLPEPGDVLPLRRGASAPRDGLLIDAASMLRITQEYDRMRYLLTRASERDRETCEVRIEMERARIGACEDRLRLRDELWTARQAELVTAVTEARQAAQRAGERQFWESPALWFAVGVVATVLAWVAASVR